MSRKGGDQLGVLWGVDHSRLDIQVRKRIGGLGRLVGETKAKNKIWTLLTERIDRSYTIRSGLCRSTNVLVVP